MANGTQGRVMMFHPKATSDKRSALSAGNSGLMARFLKETSLRKDELFPDVDHIDVQPRAEGLKARGEPIMLQLSLVPAYALTIHNSIIGLENYFALPVAIGANRDAFIRSSRSGLWSRVLLVT